MILAHLKHLKDHGEEAWLKEGIDYIKGHDMDVDISKIGVSKQEGARPEEKPMACGCPGMMAREIKRPCY